MKNILIVANSKEEKISILQMYPLSIILEIPLENADKFLIDLTENINLLKEQCETSNAGIQKSQS